MRPSWQQVVLKSLLVLSLFSVGFDACRDPATRERQRNPGEPADASAVGSGYGPGRARRNVMLGCERPNPGPSPVDNPIPATRSDGAAAVPTDGAAR